jgi:hypothetical protein
LTAEVAQELRHYLWLGHGHRGMYGDDGEMQCIECARFGLSDYKRKPLADVIRVAAAARRGVNLAALSAVAPPASESWIERQSRLENGAIVSVGGLVTALDSDPPPQCSACNQFSPTHLAECPKALSAVAPALPTTPDAETERGPDRRETALAHKVRAKVQRIAECERQIELIQAEIACALKVLEEAHAE